MWINLLVRFNQITDDSSAFVQDIQSSRYAMIFIKILYLTAKQSYIHFKQQILF